MEEPAGPQILPGHAPSRKTTVSATNQGRNSPTRYTHGMPFSELPVPLTILWSMWLLQAAVCVINAGEYARRVQRQERRYHSRMERHGPYEPGAVVVVPVKGADDGLRHHVSALSRQDYPRYRVQYVVESAEDAAHRALLQLGCDVLVAGRSERGGQKVHNLLAALNALRNDDEVVVFADADGVPSIQWLRRLIAPLRNSDIGATSSYRWLVPGKGLASVVMAILNRSVATLIAAGARTFAWGGSTAIRRDMIEEIKLREFWNGALSDDYRLSAAVRESGKRISSVPICGVASPVCASWSGLWEFGRRQYLITRRHVAWIWWVGLLSTGLYTASFTSAVIVTIDAGTHATQALTAIAAVFALDALRAVFRVRSMQRLFAAEDSRLTDARTLWLELFCTPLWMAIHFSIVLGSAFGNRITWAGITYDLKNVGDVRIVARR